MFKKLIVTVCTLININLHAQVITDGTLGRVEALSGPDFLITEGLGQQEGGNLFHSFRTFNIDTEQSATFTGPNSINNIITRVTGGSESFINGALISNIEGADLYLLNPSGILFGENASLDITGSFHASTADVLHLKDGGRFAVSNPNNSLLTVAPPSAFGFLNNNPGAITIQGSSIEVLEKQKISLIGGDIAIEDGIVYAPSGRINLAAVASKGDVEFPKSAEGPLVINATQKGEIRISHFSEYQEVLVDDEPIILGYDDEDEPVHATYANIDVSNYHGTTDAGKIFIQGGKLVVEGASLFADVYENGEDSQENTEAAINIAIEGDISLVDNAFITTNSETQTNSGDITITAENMTFRQTQEFDEESGDFLDDYLGIISTDSFGPSTAGDIHIKLTDSLDLNPGAILSTAQSYEVEGNGGNIHIDAKTVTLQNGGMIAVETFGENAGNITINATDQMLLRQTYQEVADISGGISASTFEESIGRGGNIYLKTPSLILEAGEISAVSEGSGNAGSLNIKTNTASLTNMSSITTEATQARGGDIHFDVLDYLHVDNQSRITAEASGKNTQDSGGNISISNPAIFTLDNSQLLANAYAGNGGKIDINTHQFNVLGNSRIDVSSELGFNGQFILNSVKLRNELLLPPPKILSTQELWSNRCARLTRKELSTFKIISRDTLPETPGSLKTQPYVPEDEE